MIARAAAAKPAQLRAVRSAILQYLLSHPCVDCGENDPIVLEFDHIGKKDFDIGSAGGLGFGVTRILAEIAKCEVRCANCHRRKTYHERGLSHKEPKSEVVGSNPACATIA
jgi:hypothetical protein